MTTTTNPPVEHQNLIEQLRGLDNRFWIVNVMEMLERFAYYGVRAVIALYIVLPKELGGPEFNHIQKGLIFAWWAYVQSLLPAFTGGLADRYGHKNTIAVAIILKCIGYFMMAQLLSFGGFLVGCLLLAGGTAIFKPGVQGTLAATLKQSHASVGWGIFYQLVNIGGFLGPVLAGVIRNDPNLGWKWVFYACSGLVLLNFFWLPFYKDPTQEQDKARFHQDFAKTYAQLSQVVTRRLALGWITVWGLLSLGCAAWALTADRAAWGVEGWNTFAMAALTCAIFLGSFLVYLPLKPILDQGRSDVASVFIVSVVGLFQHRVIWFCIAFAGFWLMFNQVFDLLPNVIDDWVDTSGIIAALGSGFSGPVLPGAVAIFLGVVFPGVCAIIVLLAMRPDRRSADEVPPQAYVVVALGWWLLLAMPLRSWMDGGLQNVLPPVLAAAVAAAAYTLRLRAKPLALACLAVGLLSWIPSIWSGLMASSASLIEKADAGGQVNPEWMINLNPGLIVFTVVFFAYLASFVKPLTSILIGMLVATIGAVFAGTATVGLACLFGIAVFSVGEMLSSPKKMEFLASLAPKGGEGLFMGYANVPVAIGWIVGSLVAGNAYERTGDKVNLAKKHLTEVLNVPTETVDALQKSEVMPTLASELNMTVMEAQKLLFQTYDPQHIWFKIAAIGLGSIALMLVYTFIIRKLETGPPQLASGQDDGGDPAASPA
jgi:dipeptide/tripeptide permease